MTSVAITDVLLRDGLQDEPVVVPAAERIALAHALASAGLRHLEVASFVNPARVPQMADAEVVLDGVQRGLPHVEASVLTLNGRGVERALTAGARTIAIVTSASEAHSTANAGRGVDDALASLAASIDGRDARFVAGVSTAFTCPFEGAIPHDRLIRVVRGFLAMGVREIGLADTLGTTTTADVLAAVDAVLDAEPDVTLSLHLHDAHGQALATALAAVERGVTRFDASVAGFGGCPFAPGAHGNLATEDLVRTLHASGHDTGIDEEHLADAARLARATVGRAPALATSD